MIAARNARVIAFDNVSHLPNWLSDALCRLATGGGFSTRELYTDAEECIFDGCRPCLLTGIEEVATRGDLQDRAISLCLPAIGERDRLTERELHAAFAQAQPRLLGALLDAASCALRREPQVHLPRLPRMADFAVWATAGETALGWPEGSFLRAYEGNRADSGSTVLESDCIVPLLQPLAQRGWEGTATELLGELEALAEDTTRRDRTRPKTARMLAGRLRRLAPALRASGVEVEFARQHGGRRTIVLSEKEPDPPSPPSPPSPSPEEASSDAIPAGDGSSPVTVTTAPATVTQGLAPVTALPPALGGDDGAPAGDGRPRDTVTPPTRMASGFTRRGDGGDDGDDARHHCSDLFAGASLPRMPENVRLVTLPADLPAVVEALAGAEQVGVDTETTGLNPRKDRLRLLSLATPAGSWVIDCFQADPSPLWDVLSAKPLILHHAAFDLAFLAALGFPIVPAEDTLILSRLLRAGERAGHSLAEVAKRELGEELPKELQRSDWSRRLTPAQLEYAARDARVLLPLHARLSDQVAAAGLWDVWKIERRCLPAMVWLAGTGVPFDAEAWEGLAQEAEQETARLAAELNAAAPAPPGLDLGVGWNWGKPDDVLRALREAGCDLPDTRDETLAACPHPLAALVRRHRETSKRGSAFGRNWLPLVQDGRIFADWHQLGSEAGRMSCRQPNVQQIPRLPAYRACVRAPEGRVLIKADYSQVELRIAARVANDARMIAAYQAGEDLHVETARRILGVAEVTREHRQLAKAVNFGLLYGMGADGFRVYAETQFGVKLAPEDAARYRAAFFRAYPGLADWHRQTRREKASVTRTLAGRRRLMDANTPDTQRLNSPVQGTGADGLKRALALLWERRAECPEAVPVLVCHDEILVECPQERAQDAEAWLRRAMADGMAPLVAPVPIEVETKTAPTWAG